MPLARLTVNLAAADLVRRLDGEMRAARHAALTTAGVPGGD
ncbi:hypothetical protein [Streptomyces sp. SID1328]|nr:hypothetical protein [Streptomyces sp. SID1328]